MNKTTNKKNEITITSLNTMGLFNFDSFKGFLMSWDSIERGKKISDVLLKENADIISLQEVHTYKFLTAIKSRLTRYKYSCYVRSILGPRGGLVILSKIPLEKPIYQNFQDRGTVFNSSIVAILRRSGVLFAKTTNMNFFILNTHLTQNSDFDWGNKNRFYKYIKSQLVQILKLIKNLSNESRFTILTGDFNLDKKSTLYKTFIKSGDLIDTFAKHESPTMHQFFLPKPKKARRLDYIFISSNESRIQITNRSHIFTGRYIIKKSKLVYLSDHVGLKITFSTI